MAIFNPPNAIKRPSEITIGMELWNASMQFRGGSVDDKPSIVTSLPEIFGTSKFNETQPTVLDNLYNSLLMGVDCWYQNYVFLSDNNIFEEDNQSYNDHFFFRTKEEAEEFVTTAKLQIETDEIVRAQFEYREEQDSFFDEIDDMMDDFDQSPVNDYLYDFGEDDK